MGPLSTTTLTVSANEGSFEGKVVYGEGKPVKVLLLNLLRARPLLSYPMLLRNRPRFLPPSVVASYHIHVQ